MALNNQRLDELERDLDDLRRFVNQNGGDLETRDGTTIPSLAKVANQLSLRDIGVSAAAQINTRINNIYADVPEEGDSLNKLYNLILNSGVDVQAIFDQIRGNVPESQNTLNKLRTFILDQIEQVQLDLGSVNLSLSGRVTFVEGRAENLLNALTATNTTLGTLRTDLNGLQGTVTTGLNAANATASQNLTFLNSKIDTAVNDLMTATIQGDLASRSFTTTSVNAVQASLDTTRTSLTTSINALSLAVNSRIDEEVQNLVMIVDGVNETLSQRLDQQQTQITNALNVALAARNDITRLIGDAPGYADTLAKLAVLIGNTEAASNLISPGFNPLAYASERGENDNNLDQDIYRTVPTTLGRALQWRGAGKIKIRNLRRVSDNSIYRDRIRYARAVDSFDAATADVRVYVQSYRVDPVTQEYIANEINPDSYLSLTFENTFAAAGIIDKRVVVSKLPDEGVDGITIDIQLPANAVAYEFWIETYGPDGVMNLYDLSHADITDVIQRTVTITDEGAIAVAEANDQEILGGVVDDKYISPRGLRDTEDQFLARLLASPEIAEGFGSLLRLGTEQQLADITSSLNTTNKRTGTVVEDEVTGFTYRAKGPLAGDPWIRLGSGATIRGKRYYRTIWPGQGVQYFNALIEGQSYAVGNSNNVLLNNIVRPDVVVSVPNPAITAISRVPLDLSNSTFLGNMNPDTGAGGFNALTGQDNNFGAQFAAKFAEMTDIPVNLFICARANTGLRGEQLINFQVGHAQGPTNGWIGNGADSDLSVLQDKIVSLGLADQPGNPAKIDLRIRDQMQTSGVDRGANDNADGIEADLRTYVAQELDRSWYDATIPWLHHDLINAISVTNVNGAIEALRRLHFDPTLPFFNVVSVDGYNLFDGLHPNSDDYVTMGERALDALFNYGSLIGNAGGGGGGSSGTAYVVGDFPKVHFDLSFSIPPGDGEEPIYGAAHGVSARFTGAEVTQTFQINPISIGGGEGDVFFNIHPSLVPFWPSSTNVVSDTIFLAGPGGVPGEYKPTVFAGGRLKLQRARTGEVGQIISTDRVLILPGNYSAPGNNRITFLPNFDADDPFFTDNRVGDPWHFMRDDGGNTLSGLPTNLTVYERPFGIPVNQIPVVPFMVVPAQDWINLTTLNAAGQFIINNSSDGDVFHFRTNPDEAPTTIPGIEFERNYFIGFPNGPDDKSVVRFFANDADRIAGSPFIEILGAGFGILAKGPFTAQENRVKTFHASIEDAQALRDPLPIAGTEVGYLVKGPALNLEISSDPKGITALKQTNAARAFDDGQNMLITVTTKMSPAQYRAFVEQLPTLGAIT